MSVDSRYTNGEYLKANPDWDSQDAAWKAANVRQILIDHNISPKSVCDIGCGSGDVLANLPYANRTGFDISTQLSPFWKRHSDINFISDLNLLGRYDVMLMLDVFEHVRDPFTFLEFHRMHADYFVFHIPLDLCAMTVFRASPLLYARREVGHLHYYTKDLSLETLRDTGYEIIDWRYTNAYAIGGSLKTRIASIPRRLAYAFNKDLGVRLLGGETLLVLAQSPHLSRRQE